MFTELYDYISLMFYWRWPTAEGHITAVRVGNAGSDELHLFVEYQFSVGNDGAYTGETKSPLWFGTAGLTNVNDKFKPGQAVTVRYRRDDPAVNKLDRSFWQGLEGL